MYGSQHQPTQIKLHRKEKRLEITFDDGKHFCFSAEFLRVLSPSAEMIGPDGKRRLVAGRRHVGIVEIEPVGSYAIRLGFDDLHESGIYSWQYLYDLGQRKYSLSKEYLKQLKAAGKSRDPSRPGSAKAPSSSFGSGPAAPATTPPSGIHSP